MPAILLVLLGLGAALIAGIVGVVGWIALTLFKNELNLKITTKPQDPPPNP